LYQSTVPYLAMGYKKDIFGSFAYEFELLQKSRRKPCISSFRKEMQPAADDIHLR